MGTLETLGCITVICADRDSFINENEVNPVSFVLIDNADYK